MSKREPLIPPPPLLEPEQASPMEGYFSPGIFLQQIIQIFIRPSVASFDSALGGANWRIVLIALSMWSIINGLLGIIGAKNPGVVFLLVLFSTFASLFIAATITYIAARLLGGTGDLLHQTYMIIALILIPVNVFSIMLSLIPGIGEILALLLSLYSFYLIVLGTASAQQLSQLKAAIVTLILIAITFVVGYLIPGLGV